MTIVRCGKRKEKKCKEVPEICHWEDNKCKANIHNDKPLKKIIIKIKPQVKIQVKPQVKPEVQMKVKSIRCSMRKEKGCKEVPDNCIWNGTSCINKIDNKIDNDKEKIISKVIHCAKRKEEGCKKVPQQCKWNGIKCITRVKSVSSKESSKSNSKHSTKCNSNSKPSTKSNIKSSPKPSPNATFLTSLKNIKNRHCIYYSADKTKDLKHRDDVNTSSCFKEKYDSSFKPQTNIHIGQRKLLLSEIQLLTEWYDKNNGHPILLYVGAAPGTHLILLSYMFPNVFFILYDGAKFDPELKKYPNIYEIHEGQQGFVTTDLVKSLKPKLENKNLLFVSDIRLGEENENKFEAGVTRDMKLQEDWMEILKPKMSLLKFRMSYHMKHGDKLEYTNGKILYGIWPKPTSGETRLLVTRQDIGKKRSYDYKDYEESMFFHNKYQRPYCYADILPALKKYIYSTENNVYCPCYDCVAELMVLLKYSQVMKVSFDFAIKRMAMFMNKEKVPAFQNKGLVVNKQLSLQPIIPNCNKFNDLKNKCDNIRI